MCEQFHVHPVSCIAIATAKYGSTPKSIEYLAKDSPFPAAKKEPINEYVQILDEENEMSQVVNIEEDTGLAETIRIDEDPIKEKEEDDALHPKKMIPAAPVSEDSGTLF